MNIFKKNQKLNYWGYLPIRLEKIYKVSRDECMSWWDLNWSNILGGQSVNMYQNASVYSLWFLRNRILWYYLRWSLWIFQNIQDVLCNAVLTQDFGKQPKCLPIGPDEIIILIHIKKYLEVSKNNDDLYFHSILASEEIFENRF